MATCVPVSAAFSLSHASVAATNKVSQVKHHELRAGSCSSFSPLHRRAQLVAGRVSAVHVACKRASVNETESTLPSRRDALHASLLGVGGLFLSGGSAQAKEIRSGSDCYPVCNAVSKQKSDNEYEAMLAAIAARKDKPQAEKAETDPK